MAQGEKIIGIDLGTTNSVVAVMEGREAKVIPNRRRQPAHAQRRRVHRQGRDVLVGEPARRQAVTNPTRTVYSIKRFMGRRHNEVASEEKIVPYEVVGGRRTTSRSRSATRNTRRRRSRPRFCAS